MPGADVAPEQRHFQRLGNIDAGILQQRDDIVGGRSEQRVLEVEQADAGHSLPLRQPEQIRRMIVAQHPGPGRLDHALKRRAPQRQKFGFGGGRDRAASMRQVPIDQQFRFDQKCVEIVG